MKIQAALVKEQGQNFAVVVVKRSALTNLAGRNQLTGELSALFGGVPAILMAQDSRGIPEYYGRRDIVRWLSNSPSKLFLGRNTRSPRGRS